MSNSAMHSVSVAGVVVAPDGRFLVIQRRDNSQWEPPGGVLELHESPADGVRREVWEETGVTVDVGPLTGVYKNMSRGVVALVFRCVPGGGAPTPSNESVSVRWMTSQEVRESMAPAYAVRVLDAMQNGEVHVRVHDGVAVID